MEVGYKKEKKSGIVTKLRSYLSIRKAGNARGTPRGWFLVHVGPEKEGFVIKTECVNHPLFKMLLEDAESEYGFSNQGPLHLPCDVDLFSKVLAEMDDDCDDYRISFGYGYGSCSPFSPTWRSGGYGRCSYDRLTPPRMLLSSHS